MRKYDAYTNFKASTAGGGAGGREGQMRWKQFI